MDEAKLEGLMLTSSVCADLGGVAALLAMTAAHGHEVVGNRLFPATLATADPGVNDELALPTISVFKTGDDPSVKQRDMAVEFSKRITEDFAVEFAATHSKIFAPGGPAMTGASGWPNIETTFKHRHEKNPAPQSPAPARPRPRTTPALCAHLGDADDSRPRPGVKPPWYDFRARTGVRDQQDVTIRGEGIHRVPTADFNRNSQTANLTRTDQGTE